MKIILIGNYLLDKQESMLRFEQALYKGFAGVGVNVDIWRPGIVFGSMASTTSSGLGKWLGYIDKWVIFPLILWKRLSGRFLRNKNVFFHICDHSNAPYLKRLPKDRTVITCHDVIAIQWGLGLTDIKVSATGKIFQKWILSYLAQAKMVACVSRFTFDQLIQLLAGNTVKDQKIVVVHNALNADFKPVQSVQEVEELLQRAGYHSSAPFILHVGSGLPRKNRPMLIDMVKAAGDSYSGNICFAGVAVNAELQEHAEAAGLGGRVFSIVKPEHHILCAFYSACEAFVFPSFAEGFGWPVIEAQACGAAVISSSYEPMPEVSGGAALFADPTNPKAFADALVSLKDKTIKDELIRRGFENAAKFEQSVMIDAYLELYS